MAAGLMMAARPPVSLGFLTPTHVFSGGNGTGGSVTATGSIAGDFAIGIVSDNDNSIPDISGMTGVTAIGDGIASDESGNDAAIRCVGLCLTSSGQALPAGGASRIASRKSPPSCWLTANSSNNGPRRARDTPTP